MSLLTSATRMWLTRTVKPFTFTDQFDSQLDYSGARGLGLYVHMPFCRRLCGFCPYCKELFSREKADRYLDALLAEIQLVCGKQPRRQASSLYFGGGTPALLADRLGEVISALEKHFDIREGIGVELHPDNVNVKTLTALKEAGVTKISIGIQSFQPEFLNLLGRSSTDYRPLFEALAAVPFETVSMDFIFALPGQTLELIQRDLEIAFSNGANHAALYPFIDFSFTRRDFVPMDRRDKRRLLDGLTAWCAERGWRRDSIWTWGKGPESRYSSMTRENFLGFGCSATTLLRDQFKINTFDLEEYCRRIAGGRLPTALTCRFTERQRMVYWLFWSAYTTAVDEDAFFRFFGKSLDSQYGGELRLARRLGLVEKDGTLWRMTARGAWYYHYYEGFYTLSYIDKMWSLLGRTAFPKELKL